ncbi:MAG: hypothetical protein H6573_22760 [Lewinellaceae bacterium]|nr:hypothetical protein [Lewinellaceae bacterium]
MENSNKLLLSAQRASLGMITSNMRAITVGVKNDKLFITVFFENTPSEEELELISEMAAEIIADFPYVNSSVEVPVTTSDNINNLKRLDFWVFKRYELD